jgi:hypothetical protein
LEIVTEIMTFSIVRDSRENWSDICSCSFVIECLNMNFIRKSPVLSGKYSDAYVDTADLAQQLYNRTATAN